MAYVTSGLVQYLNAQGQDNLNNVWEANIGSNATLINSALNNTTSGFNGTIVTLDGIDDVIETNVSLTGDFTICMKLKAPQAMAGKYPRILSLNNDAFDIDINGDQGNNIALWITNQFYSSSAWVGNTDTYIVMKRASGISSVYINNVLSITSTDVNNTTITTVDYGNRRNGFDRGLNGKLYSIMVYNRTLTDTEITQNYTDATDAGTTTNNLTSAITSVSAVNASLNVTGINSLSGSITSSSSLNASLLVTKALSGNILDNSTVSASLTIIAGSSLNGNINITSSVSANLTNIVNLNGNINAISSVQANLTTRIVLLEGNIDIKSSINANISAMTIIYFNAEDFTVNFKFEDTENIDFGRDTVKIIFINENTHNLSFAMFDTAKIKF